MRKSSSAVSQKPLPGFGGTRPSRASAAQSFGTAPPSAWKADEATPQRKSSGNSMGSAGRMCFHMIARPFSGG